MIIPALFITFQISVFTQTRVYIDRAHLGKMAVITFVFVMTLLPTRTNAMQGKTSSLTPESE